MGIELTGLRGIGSGGYIEDAGAAGSVNIDTHVADLDAHTLNAFEQAYIGTGYSPFTGGSYASVPLTANRLYAEIIYVARTMTFSDIWINRTTAGAGGTKARLGVYNASVTLTPSTLKKDYGEVDVDATGVVGIASDLQLTKGYYFRCVVSDGAPVLRGQSLHMSPLGYNLSTFNNAYGGFYGAHTYGALPATFPTPTIDNTLPVVLLETKTLD